MHMEVQKHQKLSTAFTIVELIIVITLIGILATISVIGLGSWRTHVAETEVKSDITNLQTGMEDARNRINGFPVYAAGTKFDGGTATKNVFVQSEYVTVTYARGGANYYCVDVQSKAVSSVYLFLDTSGGNKTPMVGTC